MPQNFIDGHCEQGFLLPPDVRDWLPADHLAWFVIDAVQDMDLAAFYGAYRADGHGRAAYEPSMMVTLVLYAYATKQRSSRTIEGYCRQDVAYRVITGNLVPDHATIARFVVRHEQALAGLFGEVLKLCGQAGLVKSGLVAIDGTRLAGNACREANREFEFDAERIVARVQGREGWLRDARRQLEQRRWQDPDVISRSRAERLLLAAERLEADLDAERRGNQAYEEYRARGRMKDGRRFGGLGTVFLFGGVSGGRRLGERATLRFFDRGALQDSEFGALGKFDQRGRFASGEDVNAQ